MKISDPIYGDYIVPERFVILVNTAAIQRLRWVRLSNVASLTYPAIANVSRFAHSVGVLVLADRLASHLGFDHERRRILMCAAILHDAGIPPLGHLMEEALREVGVAFDHEETLKTILLDQGRRFKSTTGGSKLGVIEALSKIGVPGRTVFDAIRGRGDAGSYIAAEIDLDNVDNVARIHDGIFRVSEYNSTQMAIGYFSKGTHKEEWKRRWERARMKVYHELMFSLPDFAQKATLKRLLREFLLRRMEKLGNDETLESVSFLNDDEMLVSISSELKKSERFVDFRSGKNDRLVTYGWVDRTTGDELSHLRERIGAEYCDYYVDFIPDKRRKYSSTAARPDDGAFVGLFCTAGSASKGDAKALGGVRDAMPCLAVGRIPPPPKEIDTQASLF